ncbi:conserved membrane hypothetical protein [Syntrophobacter sp. SbD1]|nr:conserved membrane hypothetical protein [Syntrophobacter sp. SbD1]
MEKGTLVHRAFVAGIVLKGVDAVLEILGGISFFFLSPQSLNVWTLSLIEREFPEGLRNFLLGWLGHNWSIDSQLFATFYLVSHGVMKLFIATVLLKGKIWAYHTGIVFFFLFILYQLYRYAFTHSVWLIILSGLDMVIIYLTWEEYKRVKRNGIFDR